MFCRFRSIILYSCLCLLFSQGHLFSQTETATASTEVPNPDDLIHFGDLVEVDVIGSTEFDWRGTINAQGFLDGVDFIEEPVFALCRDGQEVAKDVAKGFSKILRNPKVEVRILDRSGRPISYLYGAVKTPQRFKLNREIRLNELIILSGGVTEKASGEIQILRSSFFDCKERIKNQTVETQNIKVKQESGTQILNIKISDLIQGKIEANPTILEGDIVTILESDPIYIIGGVTNPRQINTASKMTLTRAIASAGGFSKDADVKNIVIFRKDGNGRKVIEVNFEKIEAKDEEDIVLEKFDIIDIGQRGREKRKFAPIVKNADFTETRVLKMPLRIIE